MAVQRRFHAFQTDQNIAPFLVEGTIVTGRQLGVGSYGSVEEVEVNGLMCAGKKIHEMLLDADNIGVQEITRKYVDECQLLSNLRHPNITLFLGVCFVPNFQLPVLLMEKLEGSLDDLLETVPKIPLILKQSMLEDVARGLLYLHKHNPQIVHRDLTAKNVLVTTSFVAKITDFGNSRIVNLQPGQVARTLSRLPGTLAYMPPEALSSAARYGPSIDVFSFGHLALFTMTQVFPGDLLEPTYVDPENPDKLVARSEVDRREIAFQQLEAEHHCFEQLIKDCLNNIPVRRPTAEQLVSSLAQMRSEIEGPFGEVSRADAVRHVVTLKALIEKQATITEQSDAVDAKDDEIQRLQLQIEEMERRHQIELQQKDVEHQQRITEVQQQLQQLQVSEKNPIDNLVQQQGYADVSRSIVQGQQYGKTQLLEPKLPLAMKWRRGKDMPQNMSYYPEAVVLDDKVYVGAGASSTSEVVMVYRISADEWSFLPKYDFYWFGMTSVKNQLVLVGGVLDDSQERTNRLGVWDEAGGTWLNNIPPMPTARSGPSVVTYKNRWMVVTGGYDLTNALLSIVEIMDILTGYWHQAASFPVEQYKMSSTLIGNMWYLLGGYPNTPSEQTCVSVCLDELIHQAVFQLDCPSPWELLPDTPVSLCTALNLDGALFAVGGRQCSSIHLYEPSSNNWVKAGDLPFVKQECACTLLPSGEVLVIGGDTLGFHNNYSDLLISILENK